MYLLPYGRLAALAGFVHFDIFAMRGQHVFLKLEFIRELERALFTYKLVILLNVSEVVCEATDEVLALRTRSVYSHVNVVRPNKSNKFSLVTLVSRSGGVVLSLSLIHI